MPETGAWDQIPVTRFALARFTGILRRQEAEMLDMGPAGICIWRGEENRLLPWESVRRLEFRQSGRNTGRWLQMLGGNLFHQQEAQFTCDAEDIHWTWVLEMDAEYRTADLLRLFEGLYAAGVPFTEISAWGMPLRMLRAQDKPSDS